MSEAKWKKLAPDIQAAITKAGEAATRHACEATDQAVEADVAKIHAKGTTLEPFPAAEQPAVKEISSKVAKEWADALDKRGKPGSEVLAAYGKALAEEIGRAHV